jgi:glutamyl-tRNA synthetase
LIIIKVKYIPSLPTAMKELIEKFALENAVKYGGKASPGAVIGKILSEKPEMKQNIREIQPEVQKIISQA